MQRRFAAMKGRGGLEEDNVGYGERYTNLVTLLSGVAANPNEMPLAERKFRLLLRDVGDPWERKKYEAIWDKIDEKKNQPEHVRRKIIDDAGL
jgi:hypothetical protein